MKNFKYIVCKYEHSRDCNGRPINFLSEVTGFSADAEYPARAYFDKLSENSNYDHSCVFCYSKEDDEEVSVRVAKMFDRAKPFKLEQHYE